MSSSSVLEKVEIESRGNGTAANNGNGNDAQSQKRVNEEIDAFLEAPFRFSDELRSLGSIVMFVTTLPVPKGIDLHPGFLMKGLCYFPVIGALLGVALAQILDFLSVGLQLPVIVAAAISIAVGWRITSCFHEDGLCDSADGRYKVQSIYYRLDQYSTDTTTTTIFW